MNKSWIVWAALLVCIVVVGGAFIRYRSTTITTTGDFQKKAVSYLCRSDKAIKATYSQNSVSVLLSDGRAFVLPQTVSASGIRYANAGGSIIFWSKGNGAFLMENNKETLQDCIALAPESPTLAKAYANPSMGFSIRYPEGYSVADPYIYQGLGPGRDIFGVKFTIPKSMTTGTNLSPFDTGVSIEEIPATSTCSASMFLYSVRNVHEVAENGVVYSVADSSGAGAGNLYEEHVYAIMGTNPCIAARYLIHSSNIGNYPARTVKKFDAAALLAQFDAIRGSLILAITSN